MPQRDRNKLDEKKVDSENMAKETYKLTRIRTNTGTKKIRLCSCARGRKKKPHTQSKCLQKYIYIMQPYLD